MYTHNVEIEIEIKCSQCGSVLDMCYASNGLIEVEICDCAKMEIESQADEIMELLGQVADLEDKLDE
jgi:hypothetical protein